MKKKNFREYTSLFFLFVYVFNFLVFPVNVHAQSDLYTEYLVDHNNDQLIDSIVYEKENLKIGLTLKGKTISKIDMQKKVDDLNFVGQYTLSGNQYVLTYKNVYGDSVFFDSSNPLNSSTEGGVCLNCGLQSPFPGVSSLQSKISDSATLASRNLTAKQFREKFPLHPSCLEDPEDQDGMKKEPDMSFQDEIYSQLAAVAANTEAILCLQGEDVNIALRFNNMINTLVNKDKEGRRFVLQCANNKFDCQCSDGNQMECIKDNCLKTNYKKCTEFSKENKNQCLQFDTKEYSENECREANCRKFVTRGAFTRTCSDNLIIISKTRRGENNNTCGDKNHKLKGTLAHELLHAFGTGNDEVLTGCLVSKCFDKSLDKKTNCKEIAEKERNKQLAQNKGKQEIKIPKNKQKCEDDQSDKQSNAANIKSRITQGIPEVGLKQRTEDETSRLILDNSDLTTQSSQTRGFRPKYGFSSLQPDANGLPLDTSVHFNVEVDEKKDPNNVIVSVQERAPASAPAAAPAATPVQPNSIDAAVAQNDKTYSMPKLIPRAAVADVDNRMPASNNAAYSITRTPSGGVVSSRKVPAPKSVIDRVANNFAKEILPQAQAGTPKSGSGSSSAGRGSRDVASSKSSTGTKATTVSSAAKTLNSTSTKKSNTKIKPPKPIKPLETSIPTAPEISIKQDAAKKSSPPPRSQSASVAPASTSSGVAGSTQLATSASAAKSPQSETRSPTSQSNNSKSLITRAQTAAGVLDGFIKSKQVTLKEESSYRAVKTELGNPELTKWLEKEKIQIKDSSGRMWGEKLKPKTILFDHGDRLTKTD